MKVIATIARMRVVLLVTVGVIALALIAWSQIPSNEDCLGCHSPSVASQIGAPSVDKSTLASSVHRGLTCAFCHTDAKEIPHGDLRLVDPESCNRCHPDVAREYNQSIHGQALRRQQTGMANCTDCHGVHDIQPHTDPQSLIHPDNVAETCGQCHQGMIQDYRSGVHGQLHAQGIPNAPICTDCHRAHGVAAARTQAFRLASLQACGNCHPEQFQAYQTTYHGQIAALGFPDVAKCSDCHGAHDIPPVKEAAVAYSEEQILKTCRACHPQATAGIVALTPHPVSEPRPLLLFG